MKPSSIITNPIKMKTNTYKYLLLIITSLSLVAAIGCEGSEGPTGPAGEQGPQGQQGPEGPQGPEGTANVIYSEWISFNESNWDAPDTLGGQVRREYPVDVPQITSDILSQGVVAVYAKFDVAEIQNRVFSLPSLLSLTSGAEQHLGFELEDSSLIITFHDVEDNSTAPTVFGDIGQFRYVIVPGGTPAKQNFPDFSNYDEVVSFYNINP